MPLRTRGPAALTGETLSERPGPGRPEARVPVQCHDIVSMTLYRYMSRTPRSRLHWRRRYDHGASCRSAMVNAGQWPQYPGVEPASGAGEPRKFPTPGQAGACQFTETLNI